MSFELRVGVLAHPSLLTARSCIMHLIVSFLVLFSNEPALCAVYECSLGFPMEKEHETRSVRVMAISELPNIFPLVDVWHKRKSLCQGYVDGGAQIRVIT